MKSAVTMMASSLFLLGLFGTMACSMICIFVVCRVVGGGWLFVPEEILPLGLFLLRRASRVDGLKRVGVKTGVEHLGGHGHRGGGEVLHLFQLVAHVAREVGQLAHVLFAAARMGADEVGDELLAKALLAVDAVEDALELLEQLERGLAHELQHAGAGVLGSHL